MVPVALSNAQLDRGARILARALHDDPGAVYIFPDARQRTKLLPAMFAAVLRYGMQRGEVYTFARPQRAVAIWLSSGEPVPADEGMVEAGMPAVVSGWEQDVRERLSTLTGYLEAVHERAMIGPHRRLLFLGVEPEYQGKGLGATLIRPMLARMTLERMPSYLETLKARNVPFYQRHGYRVIDESMMPGADIRVWAMRRD